MSLAGVVQLFRIKPEHPVGDEGRMSLGDHFRELRGRLLRSLLVLLVTTIAAFFFYHQLIDLIVGPYNHAVQLLGGKKRVNSEIVLSGIASGLMLQLKLCTTAGVVVSSPYWLYQIWAFILPGLHAHERKWTRVFVAVAGPLFFAGVAVGYYIMPKGLQFLISMNTPGGFRNLNDFDHFYTFILRTLLIFGLSFEIPLFVVLLSLAGVVSGKTLGQHRAWIIVGTFVFAAVATPSTDPFSMTMLAVPMSLLFLLSEMIARLVDRRRARTAEDGLADDELSPL
ncbi:twin-arginine translocase subunit TatC [Nocardioides pocheonensis]|uniref:Sec-independent protein translocase protein TatC n=1 Tax=Nocardioides pocheonensis TaxID=661485 RepID=A0A3N0GQE5_9ACTN|nr:twin-arginine translocase subunit TatC [Nocardioides pocheonensis]RNM14330.1 twin-arginine translocase subunit TatC [Nocardioides pocheonensis]